MVTKHFQELQQRELRAEREDVMKLKRIASSVAKMVREFWSNIEKVRVLLQSCFIQTTLKPNVVLISISSEAF